MAIFRKVINLLLPFTLAVACLGDSVAVSPVGGVSGTDARPFMIGFEFSVATQTVITGLAYLDATAAGLAESHNVGIFNSSDGSLLISAVVPAGTAAPLVDGFRVAPIAYSLAPGTYVIGGQKLTDSDYAIVRSTGFLSTTGIQYIQEMELQTASFTMPTTNFASDEIGSFGPSFTVMSPTGAPVITALSNAASFQPTFAPNTYLSILGTGLSSGSARIWNASDFLNGNQLPTALDGVSVTVGGTPAYVEYVSPQQINIITPNIPASGTGVPLVVTVSGQPSATAWVSVQNDAPGLFTWQTGTSDSGRYLVAQHSNYTNVGKPGLFPGNSPTFTTPAKPGETIILYGTGFGPTTPPMASGLITDKVYPLSTTPSATVNNIPAQVQFGGLIPTLSAVYQINVTIPPSAPAGDLSIVLSVNTNFSTSGFITVSN